MAIREDLFNWLAEQELWQQDLAKRLADRAQLRGAEYDEAIRMVKGAFGALAEEERARKPQALAIDVKAGRKLTPWRRSKTDPPVGVAVGAAEASP